MKHVKVDHRDAVAVVTLVDEARRNAMTAAMVDELVDTFDDLERDGTTAAVVVTGQPPAFCSGRGRATCPRACWRRWAARPSATSIPPIWP